MVTLFVPIILASVAAGLRAGSFAGLRRLRIEWWQLGLGSLAVQVLVYDPPFNHQAWALTWGPALYVVCLAATLAMLVRNALRPGVARLGWQIAALGILLNLVVVVANGGYMPQWQPARIEVRGTTLPIDVNVTELSNVTPMGADTRLAWLGDVIAEPKWLPRANVISGGDVILSLGLAALGFLAINRRSPHVGALLADS